MKRIGLLLLAMTFLFAPAPKNVPLGVELAEAQSACQYIAYGAVLTAAQWNACFQAKADYSAAGPFLPIAGGTMTGEIVTVASATGNAGLNLPQGSAPSSPVNGDLWTTSAGLYVRIAGATVGPLGSTTLVGGTTPITGTCTSGYFLYNNAGVLGCQAINSTITANSTPTSGFSAGQFAYSDGSLVQASSGVTFAGTGQLALALGTITTNLKAINITGTFNASGTTFDAPLFMNITNTASNTASLLADFQAGGASKFKFGVDGSLVLPSSIYTTPIGLFFESTKQVGITSIGTSALLFGVVLQTNPSMGLTNGTLQLSPNYAFGWVASGTPPGTLETSISRIAAGQMMLSNTTNATKLLVSSTTDSLTSRTNYADAYLQAGVNSGEFDLGSEHGGTGTALTKLGLFSDGGEIADYAIGQSGHWNLTVPSNGVVYVDLGYGNTGGNDLIEFYSNTTREGYIYQAAAAMQINSVSTMQFQINGVTKGDYAATNAAAWTFVGPMYITSLANTATTSAVCYNTSTGVLTYDGTLGTCNTSDERLKTVDGSITNALAMLMQVNGVYFHGKGQEGIAQFGRGKHVGLIAQNVATVFPSLVQFGDDGYASLAYDKLTAPIIASLHEIVESCRDAANDNFCVQLLKRVNQR